MSDSGTAKYLINHPTIKEILDEQEKEATGVAINTNDNDRRLLSIFQVRAIQSLREALNRRAKARDEETTRSQRGTRA